MIDNRCNMYIFSIFTAKNVPLKQTHPVIIFSCFGEDKLCQLTRRMIGLFILTKFQIWFLGRFPTLLDPYRQRLLKLKFTMGPLVCWRPPNCYGFTDTQLMSPHHSSLRTHMVRYAETHTASTSSVQLGTAKESHIPNLF